MNVVSQNGNQGGSGIVRMVIRMKVVCQGGNQGGMWQSRW